MNVFATAVSAVSTLLIVGSASAQDYMMDATYGTIELGAGFEPDPHEVEMQAGGDIDASSALGADCLGYVADAPDYDLVYDSGPGTLPLIITVRSAYDTTLIINTPDGKWVCDDDGGPSHNPSVRFDPGSDGLYDIWVGTYEEGATQEATLIISELESSED